MKKIVLIGCGNVGSRHLQALAKLKGETVVEIVEPSENAQALAKSRLKEIPHDATKNFVWYDSLQEVKNESELVIVATHATVRTGIIKQLLEKGHSRFLVEKMVCQSIEEYEMLLAKMEALGAKGWVNTPRRYFQSYRKIKEYLHAPGTIHLSVTAGNEGLGSNAIHFIDLFSWLSEDYKIRLSGELLLNQLFPNKRGNDLKEFAGMIVGSSQNGSSLAIAFLPYDGLPITINIVGNGKHLVVDESNERLFALKGTKGSENLVFRNEYVSNTTTKIVSDILGGDNCLLPTLRDSSRTHYELFRIFNTHIKKLTNEEPVLCPIT